MTAAEVVQRQQPVASRRVDLIARDDHRRLITQHEGANPLVPDLHGFSPQWSRDGHRVLVRKSGDAFERIQVRGDIWTTRFP